MWQLLYKKRFIKKQAPIIFVLVFGIFFSVFSFLSLYQNEEQEYIRSSDLYSKNIISKIETALNSNLSILDSLIAFYKSSKYVDREEFERFSFIVLKDKPGAKALQWIPRVTSATKEKFINETKTTDFKKYNFKKLDEHGNWLEDYSSDIYFPVYYSRPRIITQHLLGFDWSTIPERKLFIDSIHDTDAHWCHFNDIESLPGHTYPVIKALFDNSARDFSHKAIQEHLLGLVVVMVSFDDLIHDVLAEPDLQGTELHLYLENKNGAITQYTELASTEDKATKFSNLKASQKHFYCEPYQWAGANYLLVVSPPKKHIKSINIYPALFFSLCILALAILLAIYLWKLRHKEEEIEKAVAERTWELKKSNEELDQFAYIASHDLKEPIRGIYTYANFLKEDYAESLDTEANEMLDTIKDLCERLTGLISSLLEFSRLGRVDFAYKITDIHSMVENILISLRSYLDENNVEVIIENELPNIFCDSVKIGEVFRNLITNAVKYNKNIDKKIIIGCNSSPGSTQVFYVKDNGIGIDPKHYSDIFQIFRRLNPASQFAEGTGVGLTLVKRIIDRHNGKIWLESEKGKGTTFFFTLGNNKL